MTVFHLSINSDEEQVVDMEVAGRDDGDDDDDAGEATPVVLPAPTAWVAPLVPEMSEVLLGQYSFSATNN